MNRIVFSLLLFVALIGVCEQGKGQNKSTVTEHGRSITFLVASDMGRNGISEQNNIAEQMARFAENNKVNFKAVAGDPIHDDGVKSIDDKEWKVKIEDVYTASSLHSIPWYVVSGNHEYNGSVQAILDYSNVSERWNAPARYFTFTQPIGKRKLFKRNKNVLFVFIDTSPLIDKYREDPKYSDAGAQDMERQLQWLDSVLFVSKDRWKIVIGHHPVYSKTNKELSERTDMQKRVGTLLEKHAVDFYICGHIHNFQHINPTGSKIHYIVNSSASQSRPIHEIDEVEGVVFANSDPGFSMFTVLKNKIRFTFVNHKGETVYEQAVVK